MIDDEKKVVEMLVGQAPTSHPNEVMNSISTMMHWASEKTDTFVKQLEDTGLVIRKSDGFKDFFPAGEKLQMTRFWWVRGKANL